MSAWSIKDFRRYTFASFLLPFAGQTQSLIIGWQIYQIKKDPLYLGLIGLIEAIPGLALALVAGTIVDHVNPHMVYKNVIRIAILSSIMLTLISSGLIPAHADVKIGVLFLAAFLAGVGRGFRMPSTTALIPRIVPRETLHISSAWTTSGFAIASSIGPAMGGFLYGWAGPWVPYFINSVALFTALFFVSRIKIEYSKHAFKPEETAYQKLTAGIRYVFNHELLLAALTLDMFAVLFGGAVALLPIFAADILHVGSTGLGILRASASVGAMTGSLLLIRHPIKRNAGKILLSCVVIYGMCMIGFGLSKIFWLSCAFLALGGAFDSVSMVIRAALVQLTAPPEMRGRIGAVNSAFIGVSNQLGEFESGVMAKFFGTAPSVVLGGILTLVVVSATLIGAPKLKRMHLSDL